MTRAPWKVVIQQPVPSASNQRLMVRLEETLAPGHALIKPSMTLLPAFEQDKHFVHPVAHILAYIFGLGHFVHHDQ